MKRPAPGWPFTTILFYLSNLQVKHIHHYKSSAIQQNDVASDHDMLAIRWRRRKVPLQIVGAAHNLPSQSGRQSAADYQLTLQPRWQPVAFGQARRQVIVVFAVPAAHFVAVVIGIGVTVMLPLMVFVFIFIMASTVLPAMIVVIVAIFFVMAVSVVLSDGQRR
jgi:hypothetical protein